MNSQMRRKAGSTFVIIMLVVCFVLIPIIVLLAKVNLCSVDRSRVQNIVEAAALLAANDLSRIVINDENFGYVSLSNYPPIGKGTVAGDGEPLPVSGINTLVGTLRQNALIANDLGNVPMSNLIENDHANLKRTIEDLNFALRDSVAAVPRSKQYDLRGDTVSTFTDVKSFITSSLPPGVRLQSVRISNGWLAAGGRTTMAVPQPQTLAQLKPGQFQDGNYKPFVDVPIGNLSFSFAGLGSSSTIVPGDGFKPADAQHVNSIVKLECVVELRDQPSLQGSKMPTQLSCAACCQPFTQDDGGTPGVMTLKLSGSQVPGMESWSDFLRSGNFHDRQLSMYRIAGGDYPADHDARMWQLTPEVKLSTSDVLAEHLYYWLRNGRGRPRLGSVLEMVNEPFRSGSCVFVYQFERDGAISRTAVTADPFPVGLTADCQSSATIDTSVPGGQNPIIVLRDNVEHLGTISGGKHAGQPLPAKYFDAPAVPLANAGGAISHVITGIDNGRDLIQARRAFRSSTLALAIEVGGIAPSTASMDVLSMRRLRR